MGELVAKKYPTNLALGLADHTYVECGTGAVAWGCWGGKTGGAEFNRGTGSTNRANAIAENNERAGITCYLINGVCHQAANRTLLPASILVSGARGYWVSNALFGTYGRPRGVLGFCKAPFNRHVGATGDIPECVAGTGESDHTETASGSSDEQFVDRVLELYQRWEPELLAEPGQDEYNRQATLFAINSFVIMMDYRLGPEFGNSTEAANLLAIRAENEARRIETESVFASGEIEVATFVDMVNSETLRFQDEAANTLGEKEYEALFNLPRDEQVILGDPEIAVQAFSNFDRGAS